MMLPTKYQDRCHMVSEKKFLHVFPMLAYVKYVTPRWGNFCPMGHDLSKLGRGLPGDVTYQISRLYAIWLHPRRFFSCFPIQANVKRVTPGVGSFLATWA